MKYFIKQTIIFRRHSSTHTYREYGFKHVMGGGGCLKGLAVCIWPERSYMYYYTHLMPNLNRVKKLNYLNFKTVLIEKRGSAWHKITNILLFF
jgi:hypothetical protein